MNIHMYALKMASLIDGILHTAVYSELIGEFNYCHNGIFSAQYPYILIALALI
jgi:hypothetical protein